MNDIMGTLHALSLISETINAKNIYKHKNVYGTL